MGDLPWFAIVMAIISSATFVAAWWVDNILLGYFSTGMVVGLCSGFIEGSEWQKRFRKTNATRAALAEDDTLGEKEEG